MRGGLVRALTEDGRKTPAEVLALAEFQDEVKPTKEQVYRLLRHEPCADVLSAEQRAKLRALFGPERPARSQLPPHDSFEAAKSPLFLLARSASRAELGLTEDQSAAVLAAVRLAQARNPNTDPRATAAQLALAQLANQRDYRTLLKGILTPEQNLRLDQTGVSDLFEGAI